MYIWKRHFMTLSLISSLKRTQFLHSQRLWRGKPLCQGQNLYIRVICQIMLVLIFENLHFWKKSAFQSKKMAIESLIRVTSFIFFNDFRILSKHYVWVKKRKQDYNVTQKDSTCISLLEIKCFMVFWYEKMVFGLDKVNGHLFAYITEHRMCTLLGYV